VLSASVTGADQAGNSRITYELSKPKCFYRW
jgi:hypothetical protein